MADWHFQLAGQKLGPVAARRLAEMALDGRLQPTDLVHRADKTDWVEASRVQGLRFVTLGPPPVPNSSVAAVPKLTAVPVVEPAAGGVEHGIFSELKAIASVTRQHLSEVWSVFSSERRSRSAARELKSARLAVGRELFERGLGDPRILEAIRSVLAKPKPATSSEAKATTRELDREYLRLVEDAAPEQLAQLSTSERLTSADAAVVTVRSELVRQWQAAHVCGIDRRRVLIGYGTAAVTLVSLAVLLSLSLQATPNRRDPDRQVATREISQGSPATPATTKRRRENSGVPKSPSQTAYESLEILFYEEEATPFVLNLVVIAQLDDHTYEIGLPQRIGDQRAILRTVDTIFKSKGHAQIAAQGDGSTEVRNKDGFTVRYAVYKEALSETGAFVLTAKDAREMQADVGKRIKRAENDLVDALISDKYPGKDVGELKQYLNIDIDPRLLSESLINNRLRSVQREVEKRRP